MMTKDEQDQGRRGTCETCPAWIQRRARQGWGVCHLGPPTAGINTSRPITTGDDWCMSHPERRKALAVPTWPVTTHIVSEQSQLDLSASALAGRSVNVHNTPKPFNPVSALAQKPVGADGTPVDIRVTSSTTVYPDPMHKTDPIGPHVIVHADDQSASIQFDYGRRQYALRFTGREGITWCDEFEQARDLLFKAVGGATVLHNVPVPQVGAKPFPFVLQVNDTPVATIGYDPATGEFDVTMPPAETNVPPGVD